MKVVRITKESRSHCYPSVKTRCTLTPEKPRGRPCPGFSAWRDSRAAALRCRAPSILGQPTRQATCSGHLLATLLMYLLQSTHTPYRKQVYLLHRPCMTVMCILHRYIQYVWRNRGTYVTVSPRIGIIEGIRMRYFIGLNQKLKYSIAAKCSSHTVYR